MSEWAAKRFWKQARVTELGDGYGVDLDGRPLKTPAKNPLVMPTQRLAEEVACEWQDAGDVIDPLGMPWTRSANSAVDKIANQRAEVEAHLLSYAETDLICYRAAGPSVLVARQAAVWDPLLDWVQAEFGVRFQVTAGIMPVAQDNANATRLGAFLGQISDFELTGFHDLVTLSGSYVIALAVVAERDSVETLWRASRVDEDYQIEEWGEDEEATEHAKLREEAFIHAERFFRAAKKSGSANELSHSAPQ